MSRLQDNRTSQLQEWTEDTVETVSVFWFVDFKSPPPIKSHAFSPIASMASRQDVTNEKQEHRDSDQAEVS